MDPENITPFPFLTREMLKYGTPSKFELRVRHQSSVNVALKLFGLTRSGPINATINTVNDFGQKSFTFQIDDIPILLGVNDNGNSIVMGTVYVSVDLIVNKNVAIPLCAGYVSTHNGITYPQTQNDQPRLGGGQLITITTADPAADTEISHILSLGTAFRIIGGRVQLVTGATAANRRVHILFDDQTLVFCETFSDQDQIASTTRDYTFSAFGAIPDSLDDNDILLPIPTNLLMPPEGKISTMTTNRQANDNFSAMTIYGERYIDHE